MNEENRYEVDSTFFFQIRGGKLVAHDAISGWGFDHNNPLSKMGFNYQSFYAQMENDLIISDNQNSELIAGIGVPSPVYQYFGEGFFDWPYNWENLEQSGVPKVTWRIESDKLKLERIWIRKGLNFEAEIDTLDLKKLFPEQFSDGHVSADWVSGVFLIQEGKTGNDPYYPGMESFLVDRFTYIRIQNGIIIEKESVLKNFHFNSDSTDISPKLRSLMKDYEN